MLFVAAIHGNYADWSNWSGCSRSCGRGSKTRERKCISPVPRYGGDSCKRLGSAKEKIHCNAYPCPGNKECHEDHLQAILLETIPFPPYYYYLLLYRQGYICINDNFALVSFSVNGNWGSWNSWSTCSAECGPGIRLRQRRCNNPYPNYGGKSCVGRGKESAVCSMPDCASKYSLTIMVMLVVLM